MSGRKTTLETTKREALEAARAIAAKAEDEDRDLNPEERAALKGHVDRAKEANDGLAELAGDAELLDTVKNLAGKDIGEVARNGLRPGNGKTIGEGFVANAEVAEWLDTVKDLSAKSKRRVESPTVAFDGLKALRRGAKDIVTGSEADQAGALIDDDFRGLLDGLGALAQPLTVASLFSPGSTTSDLVTFARMVSITNNAATVPEATGTSAGTGSGDVDGVKPESAFELEQTSEEVKTLAHWLPATKRALSDAGQVRTLIDQFLLYGLDEELEDQLLNGDGTGENFTGVLNVSGIQAQTFDTDVLATARKAKTLVRTNGRTAATAYLLNPEDNETIDLTKDDQGRYYFGGPAAVGTNSLWGLPRIESEAVPAGTGIVANWRWGVIWDREQAGITVTDSHEDFFVRNLVAILAEMRAAFGVIRPAAFCTFDTSAGS